MIVDLYLKVLNLSISAIPLIAALLVLRLLFKKIVPRKVFYIAWALVFLRLMVPFSLESDLSFFNIVPKAEIVEENIGTSVVFVENKNERVEFPVFVNPGRDNPNVDMPYHSAITGEIVTGPDITTVPMDKNQIYGTVWIFGTGALLLFGIIGYFAVLRKLKFESIEYTDKIRLSEFFKTPVVCGLIRPKIILPMNFDLDDEAKIKSVISHECTHIRRGDNLWRLLATFTLYVHWFNPLVWICYNAFIRDMEVSCDEAVLSGAKNDIRGEYAESLVALAGNGTNPLYGGVLSFGECAVKERVKCIMNFKKTTLLIIIICVAAAAALGVIFLTNPSADKNGNTADIAVALAEGTEVFYSRESGIEMEAVITNNGEKTIWIDSATIVQAEIEGEEKFAGAFGSGGVLMLKAGESALFCGDIPMESFEGNFAFHLPEGRYTLRRAVFFDEALTPTDVYAEYSFEIGETKETSIYKDFHGIFAAGIANEIIADQSNMPTEELWADTRLGKYCCSIIGPLKYVNSLAVVLSPSDEQTIVEMTREQAEEIMSLIKSDVNLYVNSEPYNPSTGGELVISIITLDDMITIRYDGRVLISQKGQPYVYVFSGEYCKETFERIKEICEEAVGEVVISDEGETNPQPGYELYAFVSNEFEGGGKYFPSNSVLPNGIEWGDEKTADVFKKFIDSLDAGNIKSFMAAFTPAGGSGRTVTINGNQVNKLLELLKKVEIVPGKPQNPSATGGMAFHIVTTDNDYMVISSDLNMLCISIKGQKTNYYFNATDYSDEIWDIMLTMDELINEEKDTGQIGSTNAEYLIPDGTEPYVTLFSNSDKTAAVNYAIAEELRDLLTYENIERIDDPEEAGTSSPSLGKALATVDTIEFINKDDGKKYTLSLYEKGFVLSGSAPAKFNGAKITVEENTWEYFISKINTEFENAEYLIPYWFGLVSPKRVKEVVVFGENGEKYRYTQKDDTFDNFFSIFKSDIKVSSIEERFDGNKIAENPSGEYIRVKIYFETGTVYEIIAERDYITMVSSDMNYGLRYVLEEKADAYDAFLDYAEGGPINAVTG